MTYVRKFEHTDDNGDTLYAQHVTWTSEGDDPDTNPDDFVQIRTKGGTTIYLPMRVGREFAGWLIEHCTDVEPEPTVADQVRERAANAVRAAGAATYGGGGGGGIASGSGVVIAHGGEGRR